MYVRVEGTPKPQPRPRAFVRGKHAGVYNPASADDWREAVQAAFEEALMASMEPLLGGGLWLEVEFHLPRPAALRRKKDPDHALWNARKRPDLDNLAKAVMDAMTKAGVWDDDGQVCDLRLRKKFHAKNDTPHARIWVGRVEE